MEGLETLMKITKSRLKEIIREELKQVTEGLSDLEFVIDQLSNSMEYYDEKEFVSHLSKETKYNASQLKKVFKAYWKLGAMERNDMFMGGDPKSWLKKLGIREMKITKSKLKEIIRDELLNLREIEFSSDEEFQKYQAKHKMRPSTRVSISGKETTAGEASGGEKEEPEGGGEKDPEASAGGESGVKFSDDERSTVTSMSPDDTEKYHATFEGEEQKWNDAHEEALAFGRVDFEDEDGPRDATEEERTAAVTHVVSNLTSDDIGKRDAGLAAISSLSANMESDQLKPHLDSILKQANITPEDLHAQAEKLYTDSWGQYFGDEGREGGKADHEEHIQDMGEERWNIAKDLKRNLENTYDITGKSTSELKKASGSQFNESIKPLKLKDLLRSEK